MHVAFGQNLVPCGSRTEVPTSLVSRGHYQSLEASVAPLARSSHDLRQGSHNTAAYVFKASGRISLSFAERESYVTCHHQGLTVAIFCTVFWLEEILAHHLCRFLLAGNKLQVLLALEGRASHKGRTHWGYLKILPATKAAIIYRAKYPPPLFLKFMFPTSLVVPRTFPAHCHPHPWHGYHGCDLCTWRHVYIVKYLAWF